ncbi:MAG: hypothetical protein JXA95_06760 [Spirochaetales bacterium]|nr:hypothetical protein [Spirochaetales bacterium]
MNSWYQEKTRVIVLSGHYGSGKTEIAINLSLMIAEVSDRKVSVADLDIINPYFRSRERKKFLESKGIHLIGGSIEDSQTGVPSLSGEVQAQLSDGKGLLILDTGGDPEGIRLLGRYDEEFRRLREENALTHYFVFNGYRPETPDAARGEAMLRSLERGSGVTVDRLISNSHLLKATGRDEILEGWQKTVELSERTGIPIAFCTVPEWLSPPEEIPREMIITLDLHMRSDWMS